MRSKRGVSMPQEFTGWFMWGIIVLVLIVIIGFLLKDNLTGGIDYIKTLLRFGR